MPPFASLVEGLVSPKENDLEKYEFTELGIKVEQVTCCIDGKVPVSVCTEQLIASRQKNKIQVASDQIMGILQE